ncbi:MAG: signal peptidase I [Pseudomonadales bacterium]|nr:signal peptidase I [Pseudomonadales bacterium]
MAKFLVILFVALNISQNFIYSISYIPTDSMHPTIPAKSIAVFQRFDIEPQAGSIFLVAIPGKFSPYVKMGIAREGDIVQWDKTSISVNNRRVRVDPEACGQLKEINQFMTDFTGKLRVPKDHMFMIGTNFCNSEDSRIFGTIDIKNIKGVYKWKLN